MKFQIEGGRNYLWQWDKGQRLLLSGVEAGTQVHFSSETDTEPNALVVASYADNGEVYADVPNILLQISGRIFVYIYKDSGNEGHTEVKWQIAVYPREKPEDYVYTETEVLSYAALEERVKALEDGGTSGVGTISTEIEKLEKRQTLRVHLYGVENFFGELNLCVWRKSTHRGIKARWAKADRWGYGQIAGTVDNEGRITYPAVPAWMPNGGYLEDTFVIEAEDKLRGYRDIDLSQWLLPLVKPTDRDADGKADFYHTRNGFIGCSQYGVHNLKFYITAPDGTVVGMCRNSVTIGCKGTRHYDYQGVVLETVGGKTAAKNFYISVK